MNRILLVSIVINLVLIGVILYPRVKIEQISVPNLPAQTTQSVGAQTASTTSSFDEVNPESGYEINMKFGDLGPKMIALGVIDPEKFKRTFVESGQPLTPEQEAILTKGSNENIKITKNNSHFLLNFFWAVGLSNKSVFLDKGKMMDYGGIEGAANFASTGGWSLSKGSAMKYYSKSDLVPLTKEQEDLVMSVSSNIYRPCCNNSTAFPDCNHGMALLGLLQLMASSGATESQMYDDSKYFNAFWFPTNYYDLAQYFNAKEGKSFKDIDSKTLLSKDYSSSSGWQNIKEWLNEKGINQPPPKQSNGCGV